MKLGYKLALLLVVSTLQTEFLAAQVVETAQGKISGQKEPHSTITSFKGIPFAAPPVGALRWRPPQPPASWQGVRRANEFAASCIQVKTGERLPWSREFMVQNQISEDCLYLNVWTPQLSAGANLPVILFIHGGGYSEGSGAVDVYDGANLASKGAVVITINYRLGALGFLAHPELTAESEHHSSGNYGLLDQIAALRWVSANIANFGGNPHNVTIWGQSAGAGSVAALLASPLVAGLFEHGQADSGLGIVGFPMPNLSVGEQNGLKFAQEHHAASLKELRAIPAEALLPDPKAGMAGALRFAPIIDGWALPGDPGKRNAVGSDNDVAVVTGWQAGDSALFAPQIQSVDDYHQMVHKRYGAITAEFEALYPVHSVDDIKANLTASGQDRNRVSMFLWASARVKSHHQPVFTYYFDRAIPWPQHPEFGAFHTGEIPYFFLNLKMLDRPWEKQDWSLADQVAAYLVHFASKGDPNGAGLPPWPKVSPNHPQTMELGVRCAAMPLANTAKAAFWTRYFNSPAGRNSSPF